MDPGDEGGRPATGRPATTELAELTVPPHRRPVRDQGRLPDGREWTLYAPLPGEQAAPAAA